MKAPFSTAEGVGAGLLAFMEVPGAPSNGGSCAGQRNHLLGSCMPDPFLWHEHL